MWDEHYDVVVIGSGFAGLAAALEARHAGATVVVLEKMRVPGGNSAISGGLVAAAGSPLQASEGIKDTPGLMARDMLHAGLDLNHPELVRIVTERSTPTLVWTIETLGVKYKESLNHLGGHSVPRTYNTADTSGSGIIRPMLTRCREKNIEIRMKTMLTRVIRTPAGPVEGVEVRRGSSFPMPTAVDSGASAHGKPWYWPREVSAGIRCFGRFRTRH